MLLRLKMTLFRVISRMMEGPSKRNVHNNINKILELIVMGGNDNWKLHGFFILRICVLFNALISAIVRLINSK